MNSVFQLRADDYDSFSENISEINFNLTNESLLISSKGIYDSSYNYSVFVYSNETDSNLIIQFNGPNMTLLSDNLL